MKLTYQLYYLLVRAWYIIKILFWYLLFSCARLVVPNLSNQEVKEGAVGLAFMSLKEIKKIWLKQ